MQAVRFSLAVLTVGYGLLCAGSLGAGSLAAAQQGTTPSPAGAAPASSAPAGPAAQNPPANAQSPTLVERPASSPEVKPATAAGDGKIKIDVLVTDRAGNPVKGLQEKDFTLLDNNQPGKILSFHAFDGSAQPGQPAVEAIVLIDTVNLPFQSVSFERDQLQNYLRQNGGHLAQPTSLFVFTNEKVDAQRAPTLDGNSLADEMEKLDIQLRSVQRSAGTWGEVERFDLSARTIAKIAEVEATKPGRKLLIWIGPGWPLLDSPRIQPSDKGRAQMFAQIVELSKMLRDARIAVYSISDGMPGVGTFIYQGFLKGVKNPDKANPPNLSLKVLAVQTGGRVLGPNNDLAGQIADCARDAGPYYTLSFDPPKADKPNEYHDLKVLVANAGLVAHTRTGYYNQP
jgi:VWFA-related protein